VIIGYFKRNDVMWLIATHGHGGYYVWKPSALQQSNFALADTTLSSTVERKITFHSDRIQQGSKLARTQWVDEERFKKYQGDAPRLGLSMKVVEERPQAPVKQDLAHHIIIVEPA
jgi:hypothetical protein